MKEKRVVVNDKMQRGYVYHRSEQVGRNFAPNFRPQLTPKQMLQLGVFGGKYMTDCRREFPASWFAACEGLRRASRCSPQLLRGERLSVARHVAPQGLDSSAGPARLVPVVLPLLHGSPDGGRCASDPTVAGDRAPRCGDSEELRARRSRVPAQAAPGRASLGVRQPEDLAAQMP